MSFPIAFRDNTGLEGILERATTGPLPFISNGSETEAETLIDMLAPNPARPGEYLCNRLDRATMRCTRYDERPQLCRDHPNYLQHEREQQRESCEHCTYDSRNPDAPGYAYTPVEETGIFGAPEWLK